MARGALTPERRAERVVARVAELAALSATPRGCTRLAYSPEHRAATDQVRGWLEEAGARCHLDAAGNLGGVLRGRDPALPSLALGSHLDTVTEGGAWDGTLGVVLGVELLARLAAGEPPPCDVEVLAFADEEGARFGNGSFGSRAAVGPAPEGELGLLDAGGVALAAALTAFGGAPDELAGARRAPGRPGLFLEAHIEQGPVLEAVGLPVGVVTAIAGTSRVDVGFHGRSGHAGTVPMAGRADPVAAGAAWAAAVEGVARSRDGVVATVGRLTAHPGEVNVIAGHLAASLDVRSADDATRAEVVDRLRALAGAAAAARGCSLTWEQTLDRAATQLSPRVSAALAAAVEGAGVALFGLPSGAGHDAAILARVCPTGLLFVRCRGGISHDPAEHVDAADVRVALEVTDRAVDALLERCPHWT